MLAKIRSGKHALGTAVAQKCPHFGEEEHNVEHLMCTCPATLDFHRRMFGEEVDGGLALLTKYPPYPSFFFLSLYVETS